MRTVTYDVPRPGFSSRLSSETKNKREPLWKKWGLSPTRTGLKRRPGWTERQNSVDRRNAHNLEGCGPAADVTNITLSQTEPGPPLQDHQPAPKLPLGSCEMWLAERWSRSVKTRTSSPFSLITLALYRHPAWMNSALHKSTRGKKYWFYTIHFLKYIQSKIIYVSIKSCSQSARVCAIICICVSV